MVGKPDPKAMGYRREPGWRPLDLSRDSIEEPTSGRDYGSTYAADRTAYYYWNSSE